MKNGGRKCIRNGVSKRRVGFAVLDTLSTVTPTGGQKNGKKLNPKTGKFLVQKRGKFSYCFPSHLSLEDCRIGVPPIQHLREPVP